jgi:hypothetical protein
VITPGRDCEHFWRCHVLAGDLYRRQMIELFHDPPPSQRLMSPHRAGVRGRALVITTSRHDDPRLRALASSSADATGLVEVLADPRIGNLVVTICRDAPRQTWLELMDDFFRDASRSEDLLLYISGHAVKDEGGNLYFPATDTWLDSLSSTGVSARFIHDISARCAARAALMIFDTCYSGAFGRIQLLEAPLPVDAREHARGDTTRVVITASDAMEPALAAEVVDRLAQPSFFTRHVIHGLKTGAADVDGDGRISSEDLYKYVLARMGADKASRQRPQRWMSGPGTDVLVASSPVRPRRSRASARRLWASAAAVIPFMLALGAFLHPRSSMGTKREAEKHGALVKDAPMRADPVVDAGREPASCEAQEESVSRVPSRRSDAA